MLRFGKNSEWLFSDCSSVMKDFNMSKFTYIDFESSISFARSNEGTDYIAEQYVGNTANQDSPGAFFSVYRTPQAAALAALANCTDDELQWAGGDFSVTTVRCDGIRLYGADTGHNGGMTHTDHIGFIEFLKGDDWLDSDWIIDVYDMKVDLKGTTDAADAKGAPKSRTSTGHK